MHGDVSRQGPGGCRSIYVRRTVRKRISEEDRLCREVAVSMAYKKPTGCTDGEALQRYWLIKGGIKAKKQSIPSLIYSGEYHAVTDFYWNGK